MASKTRRRRTPGRSRSGRFTKGSGRRKRTRSAKRPASRRRRRRSVARTAAPRRRRRRASARRPAARRRRRIGGRTRRPRVHYKRGRYYSRGILHGVRVNPRRRRRHYGRRRTRSNPFSIPSLSSVTGVLKTGAAVGVGWVGVNAVLMIADKIGLAKIKASQSATVGALINAAVRILATPIVAKLASRFLKLDATKVAAGGAINVVLHGVQDLVASNPTFLPEAAKPLLLGYDGFGDYISIAGAGNAGGALDGYVTMQSMSAARGMRGLGDAVDGRLYGRAFA